MLTESARKSIIGIAVESTLESGDVLAILREIQTDDFHVAVMSLRSRWEKILHILIELGAYITFFEAEEVLSLILKHGGVTNEEIYREVIHTDQTLYMWSQNAQRQEKAQFDEKTKKEYNRKCLIRAIIATQMIDTRVNQQQTNTKRGEIIYKNELLLMAKKIRQYHLRTATAELKELLAIEFPFLPQSRLADVDVIFNNILKDYLPIEVEIRDEDQQTPKVDLADTAIKIIKRESLPPVDEADLATLDQMFDDIQLPPMETKIPQLDGQGQSLFLEMQSTLIEINASSIIELLEKSVKDLHQDDVQARAMEELRNIKKYCRDLDKTKELWEILKATEIILSQKYRQQQNRPITPETNKLGKIISAVAMYKIELGNNREWFKRAKLVVKIQG